MLINNTSDVILRIIGRYRTINIDVYLKNIIHYNLLHFNYMADKFIKLYI